jgi:hypothetical protein
MLSPVIRVSGIKGKYIFNFILSRISGYSPLGCDGVGAGMIAGREARYDMTGFSGILSYPGQRFNVVKP